MEPKACPVLAASTPSTLNTTPMPTMYADVSTSAFARPSALRAPKTETVMGMSG